MFSLGIEVIVFISSLVVGDLRVAIVTPIRIGDELLSQTFLLFFKLLNGKILTHYFQISTYLGLGFYFWLVVYNFCQELRGTPLLGTDYGDVERAPEDPFLRPSYQSS
jgi:hypothetical protein